MSTTGEMDTIYFNHAAKDHGFLSNSYMSDLVIDGNTYYHVEGYYQSMKFDKIDKKVKKHIMFITTPQRAKKVFENNRTCNGKTVQFSCGKKVEVMKKALLVKFLTHEDLFNKLLETGNKKLVNCDTSSYYWGQNREGRGENALGKILVGVRDILKNIKEPQVVQTHVTEPTKPYSLNTINKGNIKTPTESNGSIRESESESETSSQSSIDTKGTKTSKGEAEDE